LAAFAALREALEPTGGGRSADANGADALLRCTSIAMQDPVMLFKLRIQPAGRAPKKSVLQRRFLGRTSKTSACCHAGDYYLAHDQTALRISEEGTAGAQWLRSPERWLLKTQHLGAVRPAVTVFQCHRGDHVAIR
jgi:hypothetical protein